MPIQPPDSTWNPDVLRLQKVTGERLAGFYVHYKESWIQGSQMKSNTYIVFIETRGCHKEKGPGSNLQK